VTTPCVVTDFVLGLCWNFFALNQIIEKRREFNLEMYIAVIDLEIGFGGIDRSKLWEIFDKRGYSKHLINIQINTYNETKIKI
jgi:hypothetical protein